MTFTFFPNLPNAPDYPGDDQPGMQTNAASTNSILAVDHVSFNVASGGTHKQVTFSSENTPGAQIDPQSVLYTTAGSVDTQQKADLRYVNSLTTFQVSPVRAWCAVAIGAGPGFATSILSQQNVNVTSVTRNSAGNYTIVINASAINSTNFGVQVSLAFRSPLLIVAQYEIAAPNTVNILTSTVAGVAFDPNGFTFTALQI